MLADICTPYSILCADNIYVVIFAAIMIVVLIIAFIVSMRGN